MLHPEQGIQNPQIMHPGRDWSIGLLIMLAVVSACVTWSANMYFSYRDISISNEFTDDTATTVYRETLVQSVLSTMQARAEEYTSLVTEGGVTAKVEEVVIEQATTTPSVSEEGVVEDEVLATTTEEGV